MGLSNGDIGIYSNFMEEKNEFTILVTKKSMERGNGSGMERRENISIPLVNKYE